MTKHTSCPPTSPQRCPFLSLFITEMEAMVKQLQASLNGNEDPQLTHIARVKTPGVPHHAKAGNLNNALLNGGSSGQFVVVFDCDMICMPQFLLRTVPHFYKADDASMGLVVDEKIGHLQTPQDFYNVADRDPLSQRNRIFYRVSPTKRHY